MAKKGECQDCKCWNMGYHDALDGQFREKLWKSLEEYRRGYEEGLNKRRLEVSYTQDENDDLE